MYLMQSIIIIIIIIRLLLFRIQMPDDVVIIGYTDNTAMVIMTRISKIRNARLILVLEL